MSLEFHNTVQGKRFFEGTLPELIRQLKRYNDNQKANGRFLTLTNRSSANGEINIFPVHIETIQETKDKTTIGMTSGNFYEVVETREQILEMISEL